MYLTSTFLGSIVHGVVGLAILVEYAIDRKRIDLEGNDVGAI